MKYELIFSNKAKKDLKRYKGNKRRLEALKRILDMLVHGGHKAIPESSRAHKLSGNFEGRWECHALPDLLIIWRQDEEPEKRIVVYRIGSHSELF